MEKFRELFAESRARSAVVIGVLVIALAVPITMRLISQQQTTVQEAAHDTVEECYDACDQYIDNEVENADCKRACRANIGGDDRCEGGREGDIGCSCSGSGTLSCGTGLRCLGGICVEEDDIPNDPCAVAIDEKPNGCSCVPNSAYCASGYCNPETRECESQPANNDDDPGSSNEEEDPGTTNSCTASGGCLYDRDCPTGRICQHVGAQLCGTCTTNSGGGTVPVGGGRCKPNGDFCTSLTNCCSGYCNNTTNQCAAEPTNNQCTGNTNKPNGCSCLTNGQCQSENCEGSSPVLGRSGVCQAAQPTASPTPKNTCGNLCFSDAQCAGGVDGCGSCESPGAGQRSVCVSSDPDPTGTNTCGSTCTTQSDCAGSGDGCTLCAPSSTSRTGSRCIQPTTSPTGTTPACGSTCNTNTDCAGATGSCSVCQTVGGKKQCTTAPTATPTPTKTVTPTPPVSCGSSCATDASCGAATDGCNKCVTTSGGGKTCQRNGITPTPTVGSNDTAVRLNIQMPGIGQNSGDNPNPNNPSRTAEVQVYNSSNQLVKEASGTTTFDGTDTYVGVVNLGPLPNGVYYLHAGFDNTLVSRVPGVVQLSSGQTTNAALTILIPGDLNRNNILDVVDYNIFHPGCYGNSQCSQKSLADFNDDGQVAGQDYNILLRSFAIRQGD